MKAGIFIPAGYAVTLADIKDLNVAICCLTDTCYVTSDTYSPINFILQKCMCT